jgi:flagellar hook-associated protein 3 FlgL
MRISSSTMTSFNVAALNQLQYQIQQTQQQAASGTRLLTAASDPVAYTRAMDLSQTVAISTQQSANITAATDPLSIAGNTLQSVTSLLQDIRTTAVAAGGGSVSNASRATMAQALSGQLQQLIGLANSTDGSGNYLFSGFQSKIPPFSTSASGVVVYNGDTGQQLVQASAGRQIPVSDNGLDVFMRIKSGNGTFSANAVAANTGTGVISAGTVTNPALLTGKSYSISLAVAGASTTYTVTNTTTGLPVVGMSAQPYVSGQSIAFDGMQMNITGAPANGDTFTVAPSTNQSVFTTISNLISTLNTPVSGANLVNGLASGILNLDNSLNNILNTQSSQGLRLNELTQLQTSNDSMAVQLKQSLSALQDTNYTTTITALNQQQTVLQAAQKSYAQVGNLSMFTYI